MRLLKFNTFHIKEQLFICMCHSSGSNKKKLLMNEKIKKNFNFSVHLFVGFFHYNFISDIFYTKSKKLLHVFKIIF